MAPKFQTMPGPPERKPLDPAYKNVRNFLLNSVTTQNSPAERLAQVIAPDFKSENKAGIYADNPDVEAMALNMIGPIAYHGSPHVFDKFSMQKIGTGEGAQAYGHGLYFTSEPKVAEQYRERLSPRPGEQPAWMPDHVWSTVRNDVAQGSSLPAAIQKARDYFKMLADEFLPGGANEHLAGSSTARKLAEASEAAQKMEPIHFSGGPTGSFHQVDIPDNLLAFDEPIGRQPPEVLDKLQAAGVFSPNTRRYMELQAAMDDLSSQPLPRGANAEAENAARRAKHDALRQEADALAQTLGSGGKVNFDPEVAASLLHPRGPGRYKGQDIYRDVASDPVKASEFLRAAGIPGHSYIGDSSGVRNFVMYDDAPIKPLSRASSLAEWLKSQKEGQ